MDREILKGGIKYSLSKEEVIFLDKSIYTQEHASHLIERGKNGTGVIIYEYTPLDKYLAANLERQILDFGFILSYK